MVMEIAGHVDRRMLKRYSHVRLEAKRKALRTLSKGAVEPAVGTGQGVGYGTVNVTKSGSEELAAPQVVENDGRPERTRTVDLYRVKVAL